MDNLAQSALGTLENEVTPNLNNLESALSLSGKVSGNTLEAVARLAKLVKSCQRALSHGDLRALHKNLSSLPEQLTKVDLSVQELRSSWPHSESEEELYFSSGEYTKELLAMARSANLSLADQEGVLACYPSLLRVLARERAVSIDRKLTRDIRPGHLIAKLAENQKRPPNLKPGPFIASLYDTYKLLSRESQGTMVKFLDIYEAWCLRPGSKKEYSRQEFARDIYLLDASGERQTADGKTFRMHPGATASKNRSNLMVIITREGVERTYYSIEFF